MSGPLIFQEVAKSDLCFSKVEQNVLKVLLSSFRENLTLKLVYFHFKSV